MPTTDPSTNLESLDQTRPPKPRQSILAERLGTTKGITQEEARISLWKLQSLVRKTMPGITSSKCVTSRRLASSSIGIRTSITPEGEARAVYDGLYRCGCVWTCPICSNSVARKRRDEIKHILTEAHERGYRVFFLTLTVRHSMEESLDGLKRRFADARRAMRNRQAWKKMSAGCNIIGYIRGIEITYGEAGWHYHSHEILILEPTGDDPDENIILHEWQVACRSARLKIPNEHGVMLQKSTTRDDAGYPIKSDLQDEITASMYKTTNGNYTPWGMLIQGSQSGGFLLSRFKEYATTMPGTKKIMFSNGLRHMFCLQPEESELEIAEKVEGELVHVISPAQWSLLVKYEQRAQVLLFFRGLTLTAAREAFDSLLRSLYALEKALPGAPRRKPG